MIASSKGRRHRRCDLSLGCRELGANRFDRPTAWTFLLHRGRGTSTGKKLTERPQDRPSEGASVRFYSQALAPLGHTLGHQDEESASFGPADAAALYLTRSPDGSRSRSHVALSAADSKAVDGFHASALTAGGTDNGAPGDRPDYGEPYYAAFVLDPDGNNVEAVCTTG